MRAIGRKPKNRPDKLKIFYKRDSVMKKKDDVVIVSAARTAIGDFGGALKDVKAYELAALVIGAVIERAQLPKNIFDDVIFGDCLQSPKEASTARTALLKAGLPPEVPGVTIQRQCSSGMQALIFGVQQIKAGDSRSVIVGGTESMSNATYVNYDARFGIRLQHSELRDAAWDMLHCGSELLGEPFIMGQTAENLAKRFSISREDQDAVSLRSHQRAAEAMKAGKFEDEIIPVTVPQRRGAPITFTTDEHVRAGLTIADLSKLKPVFNPTGTVTAGNSSGLNDGAAALIIMRRDYAGEFGLTPMAAVKASGVAGCDPKYMGLGPVPATRKALAKAGMTLQDIDLIECNEAFAAQYLTVERELGLNPEITNVNGSGIGLGHPTGCTGARLIVSLIFEMARRNLSTGLATLCVGGGMGVATIIERES